MRSAPSRSLPERPLRLGIALTPVADTAALRALARAADEGGVDLIGIPDHPYHPHHLDAVAAAGDVLAHTQRVRVFTDVANLPLRQPAMLAKTAATFDRLYDGRFTLGLGAGQAWDRIVALGGDRRRPPEALAALDDAVGVVRAMWSGEDAVEVHGDHYRLAGVHPGPLPAHGVELWVGALFPRMLAATGRLADGWAAPLQSYLPYERWPAAQAAVDAGARDAGRDPAEVRRVAQVVGTVAPETGLRPMIRGGDPVRASAAAWGRLVRHLVEDLGFDEVVFWPERATLEQVERFAHDVAPAARGEVER